MRYTLTRPEGLYVGTAASIAREVLTAQGVTLTDSPGFKYLLVDTIREVEYHGEVVPEPADGEVTVALYDRNGNHTVDVPLDHPLVDEDLLRSRREAIRYFLGGEGLTAQDRAAYRREDTHLATALHRLTTGA